MRTIAKLGLIPVAVFALACAGDDRESAALDAELQRDLEMASSVGLELASLQNEGKDVVSPIEVSGGTSIRPTPGPRPQPKRQPAPVPVPSVADEPTPDPVSTVAEAPAEAVDSMPAPAEEESPEPGPIIAARPTPASVAFPAEGGGAGEGSGGMGPVIGVVIRGGGTGVDHCERHPRGRGGVRGPVSINTRFPGPTVVHPPTRYPTSTGTRTLPRH